MSEQRVILLAGCTPEPLLSYLKGLGVFRLVATQADPDVRAAWVGNQLQLTSRLDREGLLAFFLDAYQPTPAVSPWNGGSGFWGDKAAGQALKAIAQSPSPRLAAYRAAIATARQVRDLLGITRERIEKEKGCKEEFIRTLRSRLPDAALEWLDAVGVLGDQKVRYAPVLGTGGNDGNLDFSAAFMQRLGGVLPLDPAAAGNPKKSARGRAESGAWLTDSLFAEGRPPLTDAAVGQYQPGGIGGPNASNGFSGGSLVNPWDYVLMLEGALTLAGAAARRFGHSGAARAAFPFTVATSNAGCATLADEEVETARAELWLPLWHNPAVYPEVQRLFAEGRAQVGRRQAQTGLDFARAVTGLGVDRGISAFQRYGFVKRNGLAYLAAPIGRVAVRERSHARLLDQLDPWLAQVRSAAREESSGLLRTQVNQIDAAIFAYCQFGGAERLADLVATLGVAEQQIGQRPKLHEKIRPLYHLEPVWLEACDDGTAEFRLAAALASIVDAAAGPIRYQLEPVRLQKGRPVWSGEGGTVSAGDLTRLLVATLDRRLLEAGRQGSTRAPVDGRITADLADVERFLRHETDDERLLGLTLALATLRWEKWAGERPQPDRTPAPTLHRTYALLKLLFLPRPLALEPGAEGIAIRPEPAILHRLRAQDLPGALSAACQRLQSSGLTPLGTRGRQRPEPPDYLLDAPADAERLAAALLIPIRAPRLLAERTLNLPVLHTAQ